MDAIGDYRVLGEIARGGMGVVYRVQDPRGHLFALKVLLEHDPASVERFQREAQLARELVHPHVVQVHDYGVFEGRPFLVMDYVEGEDLMARLKRDGPLPEPEARRLFSCLAEGLQAAHTRGIVHRDLKPQNVLLAGAEVYLGDFGLARSGPSALTATGELVGTPAFMSPEQARGEREGVGLPADVYGFGATLYTALCGEPPFRGATLCAILDLVLKAEPTPLRSLRREDLSPGLEGLVRGLRKDPRERPPIEEVLERLGASGGGGSGAPWPLAVAACAIVLAGSLLGVALSWDQGRTSRPSPATASLAEASQAPGQQAPASPGAGSPALDQRSERLTEVEAVLGEALDLRGRGELYAARGRIERALELEPDHPRARLLQAEIAFAFGDWPVAEKVVERLQRASAEVRAEGLYWRGRALLRHWLDLPPSPRHDADYLGEARDAFREACALRPSARVLAWLGQAHVYLKDRAAAERCLAEARKLGRHDPHVFALHHVLKPGQATRDAYQLRAASFESHLIQATYALWTEGDRAGLEGLARATALRPGDRAAVLSCQADALAGRARASRDPGAARRDLNAAEELLGEALALLPKESRAQASALASRGGVFLAMGRGAEAERDLRRSVGIVAEFGPQRLLAQYLIERVADELATWRAGQMRGLLDDVKALASADEKLLHSQHLLLSARIMAMSCDFAGAEEYFSASLALINPEGRPLEALPGQARGTVVRVLIFRGRSRLEAATLGHPTVLGSGDLRDALGGGAKPYLRALLADALRREGQPEAAKEEIRRLTSNLEGISPDVLRVTLGLAEGRHEVLLDVEPGNPYSLGAALGKVEGFEEHMKAAPPASRSHPALILGLARRSREAKTWLGSSEALDRVLSQHPACSELRFERGLLRAHQGQLEAALKDLERAHQEHPVPRRKLAIAAELQRVRALHDAK